MLYGSCIFSPRSNSAAASRIMSASSVSGTSFRPSSVQ
jgi:hypothetical protein